MSKVKAFLKRKDIVFSAKRYFIDAMSAMAQGLFCSLLIGTIIKTLGQQLNLPFMVEMGGFASAMAAPAMAIAIGYALKAPSAYALRPPRLWVCPDACRPETPWCRR